MAASIAGYAWSPSTSGSTVLPGTSAWPEVVPDGGGERGEPARHGRRQELRLLLLQRRSPGCSRERERNAAADAAGAPADAVDAEHPVEHRADERREPHEAGPADRGTHVALVEHDVRDACQRDEHAQHGNDRGATGGRWPAAASRVMSGTGREYGYNPPRIDVPANLESWHESHPHHRRSPRPRREPSRRGHGTLRAAHRPAGGHARGPRTRGRGHRQRARARAGVPAGHRTAPSTCCPPSPRCAGSSASGRRPAMRDGCAPLVLGGDHSLGAGSVAGVATAFAERKQRIGLIWLDAHGDLNTPESSRDRQRARDAGGPPRRAWRSGAW